MKFVPIKLAAIALLTAMSVSSIASADAAQFRTNQGGGGGGGAQVAGGYTTVPGDRGTIAKPPQHCSDVTFCNYLISTCAETGGHWNPGPDQGPEGQPASGNCTWRD
jgi:hypothetical protein